MKILLTAATMLLLAATSLPATASHGGFIPCSDPRGCPDLLVDDLQMLAGTQATEPWFEDDCAVQEGATEAGLRQLMRFTFTSPNLGLGDLIVGGPDEHPEWFEYHACHDHFHFKEYADYRLWTVEEHAEWDAYRTANPDVSAEAALAAHPEWSEGLIIGEKRGFCVIDIAPAGPSLRHAPVVPDPDGKYFDCDSGQGVSVGWADTYDPTLDGQWIDVTDVAPGAYILEAEVNAEHFYEEMDYGNNRAFVPTAVLPGLSNVADAPQPTLAYDLAVGAEVAGVGVSVTAADGEPVTIGLPGLGALLATVDDLLRSLPTQPN